MNRSPRLQMVLLGVWMAGCVYEPHRTASSPRAMVAVDREGSAPAQPAHGDGSSSTTLDEVEQRIAAIVERTIQNAPDPSNRQRVTRADKRKRLPSGGLQAISDRAELDLGMGKRSETLQVMDESGAFCAAVTIASRLAVTALHCVRAMCDSSRIRADHPSPVGCRVPYRLPSGEPSVAKIVAISETDLIALLDLQLSQQRYGSLCCDDPRARDPVYTVSHTGNETWDLTYGRLSHEPVPLHWTGGSSTRVLVAEISTKLGSSGGGLFDVEDNLVGIQIARWSPWSTEFGKAAFIQASRIFSLAGQYCMQVGASACVGLRCVSTKYDVWNFNQI